MTLRISFLIAILPFTVVSLSFTDQASKQNAEGHPQVDELEKQKEEKIHIPPSGPPNKIEIPSHSHSIDNTANLISSHNGEQDSITTPYFVDDMFVLLPLDGSSYDEFGTSVAISGDYAVIGACGDDDYGYKSGSAYIFKRDASGTWTQESKLIASISSINDKFGHSVGISGNYAVVGAYGDSHNGYDAGSAYIFKRQSYGTWIQEAKLLPSDVSDSDYFGYAVAISGDYAVVGAYGNDNNRWNSGTAYVFKRDVSGTWIQEAKLIASDGSIDDGFGYDVAILGNRIVVGAHHDNDNGFCSGSAYIFERATYGTWIQEAKLIASDGSDYEAFGRAVDITGKRVIVGASLDNENGYCSGSVYIFKRKASGTWYQETKLTASDGSDSDYFGSSVALSGGYAVVGASGNDDNGSSSGSAYIFMREANSGQWFEALKIIPSNGDIHDNFGCATAIDRNLILIGAYVANNRTGAAYGLNISEINLRPTSTFVSISGSLEVGQTLFGNYNYYDRDGDPEGGSTYQWYRADKAQEAGAIPIEGADSTTYTLQLEDGGKHISFEVTSKASSGVSPGIQVQSPWEGPVSSPGPVVKTLGITSKSNRSVEAVGSVALFGGTAVTERGFVYSLNPSPTLSDGKVTAGSDEGEFSASVTGLSPGSTYYLRAYAINGWGACYGMDVSFSTRESGDSLVEVTPFNGCLYDSFGMSVDISGNYCIVGARRDDDNGENSGSAYIFKREHTGTWSQEAKLTPSDGSAGDHFGQSVSLSGDRAIVGAYYDDDNGSFSGSAYIFKRNDTGIWTREAKLLASDGRSGDLFGYAVAISGDRALVGAHRDDDNGPGSGSAYIFKRENSGSWIQEAKLISSDGAIFHYFGRYLTLSGNLAVVAANGGGDEEPESNFAYIFKLDDSGNWIQEAKLLPSDRSADDNFGCSVAISGSYVVVGASGSDGNVSNCGSAYLFKCNSPGNWIQEAKLQAADGSTYDNFGKFVAMSGNYILVGAFADDDNGYNSGSAYIFMRESITNQWLEVLKVRPSDIDVYRDFGSATAIDTDFALIGAYNKKSSSGTTCILDLSETNFQPLAVHVAISGSFEVGEILTGVYSYYDRERDPESSGKYKWYRADDDQGTNAVAITGANAASYFLQPKDEGKYIRFEIAPAASPGASPGVPVVSSWYGPVSPSSVKIYIISLCGSSNGSGTVTSSPGAIEAYYDGSSTRGTTSHSYISGATVTLTATPDPGSVFNGWSGGASGFGEAIVVMNSDKSVVAEFSDCPDNHDVNMDGSVTPGDALLAFQHYLK